MSLRFDRMMDEHEAGQLNALQLAYLGDSVWELDTRFDLTFAKMNVKHMHERCVRLVNARSQARMMKNILSSLTETELEIVRRGRDTHAKHPVPHHQDAEDYALSTGFEALLGFLYLTGQNERIREVIHLMKEVAQDA